MRRFNINRGIINSIEALYKASRSVVLAGGDYSECFPTSVGVRQGCLLSPTLCNIFLENIMRETLIVQQKSPVKIAGRPINHLQFADDVDLIDGDNDDQTKKATELDVVSRRYGMELSLEKTKTLVSGIHDTVNVKIRGTELEQVRQFTYLGSVQTEDCNSIQEIKVRIAKATAALSKLKTIWRDTNITMASKIRLLRALVLSILLYGAESWTLNAEIEKRISAFEMNSYRRLLQIHWTSHTKNIDVKKRIEDLAGPVESFINQVKRKKLTWFGHVSRAKGTLANTILQGTVEGSRSRGRPRRQWVSDIEAWTNMKLPELLRMTEDRVKWKSFVSRCIASTAPG